MLHLLIDTSTWLDIARRRDGQRWIAPIRALVTQQRLVILAPQLVLDEYERNRDRIAQGMSTSIAERFRSLRQDLSDFAGTEQSESVALIRDLEHQIPLIGALASRNIEEIAELIAAGRRLYPVIREHDAVIERGLAKKAPFHTGKNSVGDALLIELFISAARRAPRTEDMYGFVTSNHKDFSALDDQRKPHPDLAHIFNSSSQCRYYRGIEGLSLALRDHFGGDFEDLLRESGSIELPRTLTEIRVAEREFSDHIKYDEHLKFRASYANAEEAGMPEAEYRLAIDAAEQFYHQRPDLSPAESDYELGIWKGKLAALRWVLGSEWDLLEN